MSVHYRLIRLNAMFPQEPFAIGVAEFAPAVGDIISREKRLYRVEERRMVHMDHHIPEGKQWPVFLSITSVDLYVEPVVR